VVIADRADDMSLHCAREAGAICIVSGDRHLLRPKSYKRIKILSPSEFLSRRARK
jgi:predicted nucleic acid-binding protein